MNPEQKNRTAHGILALLVALSLLTLLLRFWPLLVPLMLGLFIYGLWTLIQTVNQPAYTQSQTVDAQPAQSVQISEQDLITLAFGLLQRRITEQVAAIHPQASWVWAGPGARERFATGGPLIILLSGAGGYQRASVLVNDLKFYKLCYLPMNGVPVSTTEDLPKRQEESAQPEEAAEEMPKEVNYGLLAFEWTEANIQRIYEQNDESIANGQTEFHIPDEELPHGDSWSSICAELMRKGFTDAEPVANGIQIKIKTQEEHEQNEQ